MCTVSYIPGKTKGDFVLTSNRDEKSFRATISPQIYEVENKQLAFPKDELAGGSWIAANNKGRICCLLNGAFVAHQKKSVYVQSRGKILIDLVASNSEPKHYFEEKNLVNVEPFTIISIDKKEEQIIGFSEFIWDGNKKHFRELNPNESLIWSSVTLYKTEHRKLRNDWFEEFLHEIKTNITSENILAFHTGTHTNNGSINVVMERDEGIKTVSVTQVFPKNGEFIMKYLDLQNHTSEVLKI